VSHTLLIWVDTIALLLPVAAGYVIPVILTGKTIFVFYCDIISAMLALCLLIGLVLSHGGKSFYRKDFLPIVTIFAIIALCLLNLVVTMWPFVVYPRYTLWDFANQNKESLKFVVVLMSVMFPVIISYTCFVYYSFRGKVKNDENFYS
jgi:cytochrome bd-type quinol oxidase subunit 2